MQRRCGRDRWQCVHSLHAAAAMRSDAQWRALHAMCTHQLTSVLVCSLRVAITSLAIGVGTVLSHLRQGLRVPRVQRQGVAPGEHDHDGAAVSPPASPPHSFCTATHWVAVRVT